MFALLGIIVPICTPLSILYAGNIHDNHSSLVSFESSDHSLTLKYPKDWSVLKSLTWNEGKVSSIAVTPSLGGMVGHSDQMVAILKIKGLPADYTLKDFVDDYTGYLGSIFGSGLYVTDIGPENISSLQGHSFLISTTSYYGIHGDSFQTFAIHNNDGYLIGYFGGSGYQHYFTQARDIMRSIELKDVIEGSLA